MSSRFDYFIVLAEMRTGSNFLEENLNEYPGIHCYGEAFNPNFIGHANKTELFGVTMTTREEHPNRLLDRMRAETDGLAGFRFFHDHDPRILTLALNDPRCAKIVLTRNPLQSYVSRKIAAATGQWRLNDMKGAKTARISFDAREFEEHLDALQRFQLRLLRALQVSGQTAFYVAYDDIQDVEVLDGMAAFLGVDHKKDRTSQKTKVQNPAPLEDKVENFDEMAAALARLDRFDLGRTPNFEPRRAAAVPSYVAATEAPLLFQPVKGGPETRIEMWLATLDGVEPKDLIRDFNQKTLRQWKRKNKGHRCFTVIRHPAPRLHAAFVTHILDHGPETFWDMREALRQTYKLPIPEGPPDRDWTPQRHRAAFLAFIRFVKGNLGGQTSLRVDASWASQSEVLAGLSQVQVPDMVLREDDLERELAQLADQVGRSSAPLMPVIEDAPVRLSEIYDDEIETEVRQVYQRDYMMFGFRAWR